MQSFFVFFITFLSIWGNNFIKHCYASVFTLKMHHRFSEPVRKWSESINKLSTTDFPSKGSVEFYSQLADHDRVFRGRGLSDSGEQQLTFVDGNSSLRIKSLGQYVFCQLIILIACLEFLIRVFYSCLSSQMRIFLMSNQFALHNGFSRDTRPEVFGGA